MAYTQRTTLTATRARQGRYGRHVLWVLLFSTALAALGVFAAWTWKSGDLAAADANTRPSVATANTYSAPAPGDVVDSQNYAKSAPSAPQPAK